MDADIFANVLKEEYNDDSSSKSKNNGKASKRNMFCDKWLDEPIFKPWLQRTETGGYCKLCKRFLKHTSGKKDLMRHFETEKHIRNAINISKRGEVTDPPKGSQEVDKTLQNLIEHKAFVKFLTTYGKILFSNERTAEVRLRKKEAIELICNHPLFDKGTTYTPQQVLNKVRHLKAKVRKKIDNTREKYLNESEIDLTESTDVELDSTENPIKVDESNDIDNISIGSDESIFNSSAVLSNTLLNPPPNQSPNQSPKQTPEQSPNPGLLESSKMQPSTTVLDKLETEETRELSNSQLQRLVLLRQLQLLTQKQKLMDVQIKLVKASRVEIFNELNDL